MNRATRPGPEPSRPEPGARAVGATVALALGAALLLAVVARHYPLAHWLLFRYLGYWLLALAWAASCLALGHVTLRSLLGRGVPYLEHLSVAFAVGVFEFELAVFLAGLAGAYSTACFVLLPLAGLAAGGRPLWRYLRRLRRVARRSAGAPGSAGRFAIQAFGCLVLLMVYLPLMTPGNVHFDSYWRHMLLAETYVAQGGIAPFPEGWAFGASPQFGSMLFSWAFMLPAGRLFDRMELCGHLEFVVFLATTLWGIPAIVRRLVPGADPRLVWVARCLFPGFLLYDSSLAAGVDHISAVFAPPLFLLGLRLWRRPAARCGVALGAMIAAAACTKETAAALLAPMPIALVAAGLGAAWIGRARARRGWPAAALATGAAAVACSAPHWLKNLIYYGDPLYPNLHALFTARPWDESASYVYRWVFRPTQLSTAAADLHGVLDSLWTTLSFSFVPHDLAPFHGDVPVFGSLFTLLLLCLPFLRGTRRIWLLAGWVHAGIFVWCWVNREDRYLQVLMPWIAAVTAAIMHLLWRRFGRVPRAALALLVAVQIGWGSDVYFFPTHAMLGTSPIRVVAELLGRGHEGKYEERLRTHVDYMAGLGRDVPAGGRLLIHNEHGLLGTGAAVAVDAYGEQFGIDYGALATPQAALEKLRGLGVTHVAWVRGRGYREVPLADEIVFLELAVRHTLAQRDVEHFRVGQLPAAAGSAGRRWVAVFGCGAGYPTGAYELTDLRVPLYGPRRDDYPAAPSRPLAEIPADWGDPLALVLDRDCAARWNALLPPGFATDAVRPRGSGPAYEIRLPQAGSAGVPPP